MQHHSGSRAWTLLLVPVSSLNVCAASRELQRNVECLTLHYSPLVHYELRCGFMVSGWTAGPRSQQSSRMSQCLTSVDRDHWNAPFVLAGGLISGGSAGSASTCRRMQGISFIPAMVAVFRRHWLSLSGSAPIKALISLIVLFHLRNK